MKEMNVTEAVKEVVEALELVSDPARTAMIASYAPTSMEVLGATNPDIKQVIREVKQKYGEWNERTWISFCVALVDTGIFECQGLAYELLGRNRKLLAALTRGHVKALAKNLDNWASVDGFSVGIHGVLWGRGVITDSDIRQLLASSDPWLRRVAVVSTVALNLKSRGGTGDTPRTLAVCEAVVEDHHDMIQKALSWALRELSKRDREAVAAFLDRHRDKLAGRVLREVTHKLEFGTKN
jgi:3-methyladenine DNA glycosylase AlkD